MALGKTREEAILWLNNEVGKRRKWTESELEEQAILHFMNGNYKSAYYYKKLYWKLKNNSDDIEE